MKVTFNVKSISPKDLESILKLVSNTQRNGKFTTLLHELINELLKNNPGLKDNKKLMALLKEMLPKNPQETNTPPRTTLHESGNANISNAIDMLEAALKIEPQPQKKNQQTQTKTTIHTKPEKQGTNAKREIKTKIEKFKEAVLYIKLKGEIINKKTPTKALTKPKKIKPHHAKSIETQHKPTRKTNSKGIIEYTQTLAETKIPKNLEITITNTKHAKRTVNPHKPLKNTTHPTPNHQVPQDHHDHKETPSINTPSPAIHQTQEKTTHTTHKRRNTTQTARYSDSHHNKHINIGAPWAAETVRKEEPKSKGNRRVVNTKRTTIQHLQESPENTHDIAQKPQAIPNEEKTIVSKEHSPAKTARGNISKFDMRIINTEEKTNPEITKPIKTIPINIKEIITDARNHTNTPTKEAHLIEHLTQPEKPQTKQLSHSEITVAPRTPPHFTTLEHHITMQLPTHLDKIIEEINRINITKPPINKSLTIRIEPPSLGSLHAKFTMDVNHNINILIKADNVKVAEILNHHIDGIKEYLSNQGVNLNNISVVLSGRENQQQSASMLSQFSHNPMSSSTSNGSFHNHHPGYTHTDPGGTHYEHREGENEQDEPTGRNPNGRLNIIA